MSMIARAGGCPIVRSDYTPVPTGREAEFVGAIGVIQIAFVYRRNEAEATHFYGVVLDRDLNNDPNGVDPSGMSYEKFLQLCANANKFLTTRNNPVETKAGGQISVQNYLWGVRPEGSKVRFTAVVLNIATQTYRLEAIPIKSSSMGGWQYGSYHSLASKSPKVDQMLSITEEGPIVTAGDVRKKQFAAIWDEEVAPGPTTVQLDAGSKETYVDPPLLRFATFGENKQKAIFELVTKVTGQVTFKMTVRTTLPTEHETLSFTFPGP